MRCHREEEVAYIVRELKSCAMENNIPIVVCSQLCRVVGTRSQSDLSLSDLRETRSIEQDSDVIILFSKGQGVVAKNRLGKVGKFEWEFDEEYLTFRSKANCEDKSCVRQNEVLSA